jgi:hypothetical protein
MGLDSTPEFFGRKKAQRDVGNRNVPVAPMGAQESQVEASEIFCAFLRPKLLRLTAGAATRPMTVHLGV